MPEVAYHVTFKISIRYSLITILFIMYNYKRAHMHTLNWPINVF